MNSLAACLLVIASLFLPVVHGEEREKCHLIWAPAPTPLTLLPCGRHDVWIPFYLNLPAADAGVYNVACSMGDGVDIRVEFRSALHFAVQPIKDDCSEFQEARALTCYVPFEYCDEFCPPESSCRTFFDLERIYFIFVANIELRVDDFQTATFTFHSPSQNRSTFSGTSSAGSEFDHFLEYRVAGGDEDWYRCRFRETSPTVYEAVLDDEISISRDSDCRFRFSCDDSVEYRLASGLSIAFISDVRGPIRRRRLEDHVAVGAPKNLRRVAVNDSSATISWDGYAAMDNDVDGVCVPHSFFLRVESLCDDSRAFRVPRGANRDFAISGLHPGRDYAIGVETIVDSSGYVSPPSYLHVRALSAPPTAVASLVFVVSLDNGNVLFRDADACFFTLVVIDPPYCRRDGEITRYYLSGSGSVVEKRLEKIHSSDSLQRFEIRYPSRGSCETSFRLFAANDAGNSTAFENVAIVENEYFGADALDLKVLYLGEDSFNVSLTTAVASDPLPDVNLTVLTCLRNGTACDHLRVGSGDVAGVSLNATHLPNREWAFTLDRASGATPRLRWRRDLCVYVRGPPSAGVSGLAVLDRVLAWEEPACAEGETRADDIRFRIAGFDATGRSVFNVSHEEATPVGGHRSLPIDRLRGGLYYRVLPFNSYGEGRLSDSVFVPKSFDYVSLLAATVAVSIGGLLLILARRWYETRKREMDTRKVAYLEAISDLPFSEGSEGTPLTVQTSISITNGSSSNGSESRACSASSSSSSSSSSPSSPSSPSYGGS